MPLNKQHKAQTRARILESAQNLFKSQGYKNTGIDQIMSGAGLTRGGFYAHFKSKNDLIAASLGGQNGNRFMASLMTSSEIPFPARVDGLLQGYLSTSHRDNPGGGCPVAAVSSSVGQMGGDAALAYGRLFDGMARALQKHLLSAMTIDQIYAVITQAVGCLQMARAVKHDDQLSGKILASGRLALKTLIFEHCPSPDQPAAHQ